MEQSGFKRLIRLEDVENFARLRKAWYNTRIRINLYYTNPSTESLYSHLVKLRPVEKLLDKFVNDCEAQIVSHKNATTSTEYLNMGNREYGQKSLVDALYLYTFAIMYAPDVPEGNNNQAEHVPQELSLAFGNRSEVFFELAQYDACLVDIEHALATGCARDKFHELLLRKVECLIALEKFEEAKKLWDDQLDHEEFAKDDDRVINIRLKLQNIDNFESKIHEPSPSISSINTMLPVINFLAQTKRFEPTSVNLPSLSAKVEIKNCPKKGRLMVAKCDIKSGDIVTVESPFASLLYPEYELNFCHHCFRNLEMNTPGEKGLCIAGPVVPCTECTRVLYCSTNCRTESWQKYHRYECSILPFLYETNDNSHLAFRMIVNTGLDVIQHVISQSSKQQTKKQTKLLTDSLDLTEKYARYEQVYRLVDHLDHLDRIPVGEIRRQTLIANLFVYLATKKCGFVRTLDEAILCGTSFLRHYYQLNINCHAIRSYVSTSEGDFVPIFTGVGIYPTSSLMNHSCYSNVKGAFTLGSLFIVRAIRPIAPEQELTDTYNYSFVSNDLPKRRKLLGKYYFTCDCSRCELEARDGLDGKYFPVGCVKCGHTLTRESSTSTSFNCPNAECRSSVELSEMEQLYHKIQFQLAKVAMCSMPFVRNASNQPISNQYLLHFENHLTKFISIKGMDNFCGLLNFYPKLVKHTQSPSLIDTARVYLQKTCDLDQMYRGDTLYLAHTFIGLAKLCLNSEEHLKRAIQLLRIFLLIDCDDDRSAPVGLIDEFSRYLWKMYQNFAKQLQVIQQG